jgi:hypothetical protein
VVYTKFVYTKLVKNVTISLPEEVLEALRQKARDSNKSLNAWLRDFLTSKVEEPEDWFCEYRRVAGQVAAPAEPWTWSREETYEERGKGLR